jgi:type IV pilus assembly protein PilM
MVGNDPGTFLVIDIGARAANLMLVEGGYVKMSRNIDAGGRDVTRTLSESLNIALDRAEILKKSTKDFLNSRETAIIFPAIEMIVNEAARMAESWKSKRPDVRFDGVVLSGGTARMTGISQYFSARLGIPATLGDPWKSVTCPKALQPAIDRMGSSFSVALGLALYGVSEKKQ